MGVLLAVDSGGSKCEAVLVQTDGTVLSRGYCNYRDPDSGRCPRGSGRAPETVAAAVRNALDAVPAEVLGTVPLPTVLCGTSPPTPVAPETAVTDTLAVLTEHDIGFRSAQAAAGVVVLAGTGAFAYGRNEGGHHLMLDAIGPIVGDNGSGHHIGVLALRASARAGWHRRHQTAIADDIRAAVATWRGPWSPSLVAMFVHDLPDRAEVASLAEIVDRNARAGDPVARDILIEAADAISETVLDVVDRLDMAAGSWPLIAMGSVATRSAIYWQRVCARIRGAAPGAVPFVPPLYPVLAMALMGLERLGVSDSDALRQRLLTSANRVWSSPRAHRCRKEPSHDRQ